MKLLVDIPKEFEQHFQVDRFEDSLHRLSVDAHLLAGLYEQETAVMLIKSFKSAVPVPPHGRLIDADALEYTMLYKENWMHSTGVEALAVWKNDIDAAPTIIPADEVET